jgi:CTP synthase
MKTTKRRRTFIFIVGGVMSGVGKGVASASLGALLKSRGLSVTAVKIDPYINVDAGTMNPVEHGEVFVTVDGDETDQDIGNYERFLDIDITRVNYMTTGRVYQSVIARERALGYGGKTVEVVPHVPLEVIGRIKKAAEFHDADVTIIEIGITVGAQPSTILAGMLGSIVGASITKSTTKGVIFGFIGGAVVATTLRWTESIGF